MHLIDFMNEDIKKKLVKKTYKKKETILFAEQENEYVILMIDGIAEAFILNVKGNISTIHLYRSGSFFGEMEQFNDGKKPVEIVAFTDCNVYKLHRDDFLNWLRGDFEATKFLIREISSKLVVNAELIEELSSLSVKERLLRCISLHYYRSELNLLTKKQLASEVNAPIR
ncbi:MAG: Crp/Fnr family transcriptional regulator, partial [Clostridioides difficile]